MNPWYIEALGVVAAIITTLCWMPQAVKTLRDRDTKAISLVATLGFMIGVGFWLAYGIALQNWPLIGSNSVTFATMGLIVALKLRHG
jgi:MtN3 and saliva related transmembrane protein